MATAQLDLESASTAEAPLVLPAGAARRRSTCALTRLDRPIGIWLLLWPMLWALWIAGARPARAAQCSSIFLLGTVVDALGGLRHQRFRRSQHRSAREAHARPAARRAAHRARAKRWCCSRVLAAVALCLGAAARLASRCARRSSARCSTVSYPFLKRFFPLPQFYLGLAFGWAVPMAFAAQIGQRCRAWPGCCS